MHLSKTTLTTVFIFFSTKSCLKCLNSEALATVTCYLTTSPFLPPFFFNQGTILLDDQQERKGPPIDPFLQSCHEEFSPCLKDEPMRLYLILLSILIHETVGQSWRKHQFKSDGKERTIAVSVSADSCVSYSNLFLFI